MKRLKRSEVLLEITKELEFIPNTWESASKLLPLSLAGTILMKLEDLGMKQCYESIDGLTTGYEPECSCIDCGVETKPGKGSARCPSCWEDRCG